MAKTALILGASGSFGGAMARELESSGWTVRRWKRGTDMVAAAEGADLIVNGLNPPNYHNWSELIPKITSDVLAAAKASGATVFVPGNVYPLGKEPAPWSAETRHRPVSRKGAIRAAMESRYRTAAEAGEAKVILLCAGDFLGTDPRLAINQVMLRPVAKGRVSTLGAPDVRHAYAYLPDMARAAVSLLARDDLPAYLDVPFPGHSFTTAELAAIVERLTGRRTVISRFPIWVFAVLSPFWEMARELQEMLYLYEHPHWMEARTLRRWVPDFSETPLETVVARLLAAKGIQSSNSTQMG
ncbi:epimerase [Thioclava sp. FR2]|uniref:epimerase n=1 Tax=Thioclava sp. FR2 TaxID=3445780 RepID=UPI003EB907C0